jgi:hypothetical protein
MLSEKRGSGEFICASSAYEIHVYLQGGRVAWATDSTHPFAFATHLQESAGIDVDTFRDVVEECRRDKLSLGETLVSWGLAQWDTVRRSLLHQIRLAVSLLADADAASAQVLFLERAYRQYDEKLTFELRELLETVSSVPAEHVEIEPTVTPVSDRPGIAQRLRTTIDGLSWVEVVEDDRLIEAEPEARGHRTPAGLINTTLLDGADFVVLRMGRSSVVGLKLGERRSIWCRVASEAPTFGAAVVALLALTPKREPVAESTTRSTSETWTLGARTAAMDAMVSFLERAQDVLGAVLLADGSSSSVSACGTGRLDPEWCVALSRRRARSFTDGAVAPACEEGLASMGFYLRTFVSGERALWCFGAELDGSGASVWIFLDRKSSQGLGWACLSALSRTLARISSGVASERGASS